MDKKRPPVELDEHPSPQLFLPFPPGGSNAKRAAARLMNQRMLARVAKLAEDAIDRHQELQEEEF